MYISDSFIEKYLGLIPPVYITSYIYFLHNNKGSYTPAEVCRDLGINQGTLRKVLRFWDEQKTITYIWKDDPDSPVFNKLFVTIKPEKEEIDEVSYIESKKLLESPEFSEVVKLTKSVFPSMKDHDITKIAYYWKKHGFRKDLFVILLKYCRDHEAKYPAYMFTVAKKWADADIRTPKAASAWMEGKWKRFLLWKRKYLVSKEPPTDHEISVFDEWSSKYSDDNILEAIDITVTNNKGLNLNYTAGVLRNKYDNPISE